MQLHHPLTREPKGSRWQRFMRGAARAWFTVVHDGIPEDDEEQKDDEQAIAP